MSAALSASSPAALRSSSDAAGHTSLESVAPVSQTLIRSTSKVSSQVPSSESLSARLSAPVSGSLFNSAPPQTVISSFATPSIASAHSGRASPSVPAPPASRPAVSQSPKPPIEVPSSQSSAQSSSRVSGTFSSVAVSRSGSSVSRSTLSSIRGVSNLQQPPTSHPNSTRTPSDAQDTAPQAVTPSEKPAPSDPALSGTPASSQGTQSKDIGTPTQGISASSAVMPAETPSKSSASGSQSSHSSASASSPAKNHGVSPPAAPPSSKSSETSSPTQKSSSSPSKEVQSPPPTQTHTSPTHESAPPPASVSPLPSPHVSVSAPQEQIGQASSPSAASPPNSLPPAAAGSPASFSSVAARPSTPLPADAAVSSLIPSPSEPMRALEPHTTVGSSHSPLPAVANSPAASASRSIFSPSLPSPPFSASHVPSLPPQAANSSPLQGTGLSHPAPFGTTNSPILPSPVSQALSQSSFALQTPSQPPASAPPQRPAQQANGQSPTQTSTVTVPPESTLSKPIVVSTTDSHGHSTVSIPPLITSLAVSTEPDGSLVTVTHVIANPTGVWSISDNADASRHGFFSNTGAVAGVFLVVGIVVTAIAAVIAFVLCKRRRRRAIRTSISRPLPYPDNPFEDPRDSPSPTQMRYAASDSSHRNLVGGGIGLNPEPPVLPTQSYTVYETSAPTVGPTLQAQQTLAGVGAGNRTFDGLGFDPYLEANPIRQSRPSYGSIGVAITSDDYEDLPPPPMSHAKHASLTPSTPSIYPATLPEDDDDRVEEPPVIMEPVPVPAATTLTRAPSTGPPIPPRSPLRNASADLRSKLLLRTQLTSQEQETLGVKGYEPLTPPATASSASSHSPSSSVAPADPFADHNEARPHDNYFTRRKLYTTEQRPTSTVEWRP